MTHKDMDSPILDKLHSDLNTIKECEVILEPLVSLILDDSPEYINYLIENGFVSCDSSLSEQERYAIEVQDRIENELKNLDWDNLGNEFRERIYQYRDVPYLYPKFVLRFLTKSGFHEGYLNKILYQLNEACLDFDFSIYDIVEDAKKKRISASKIVSNFPQELNTDEAKKLRLYLIEKSYISDQTDENIFLYWFGCLNTHNKPQPIIWIKKNSKTGSPSKKSLLNLLVLVGYHERQIKQNINNAFIIDGGKKFKAQDYTKYKDWSKGIISEYHTEIEEIVNNSKNKE